MSTTNDRQHFEDYREQTRVKHDILTAYLPAFFHILKRWNKNLLFIDGFAGRGTYTKAETGDTFDGSPLLALKLIADSSDFSARVGTLFIERDPQLFVSLQKVVEEFYRKNPGIRKPHCLLGTFSERLNEILTQLKGELAPTFLFVDPCGVSGISFATIKAVMAYGGCEAFIFFNIDGVRRIAGLKERSDVLVELLGTAERAQVLYDELRATADVRKREEIILAHYRQAINKDIGAPYIIAFRVENEAQHRTSHYFIHATKHPLGFAIMKDVMWRRGHSQDQAGALELRQSGRTNFVPLFDLEGDEVKRSILNALVRGPLKVSAFCQDWAQRPDDLQCESSYRKFLLELEANGNIEVLSKDGSAVTPASSRRKFRGKTTLGKDYFVRLRR